MAEGKSRDSAVAAEFLAPEALVAAAAAAHRRAFGQLRAYTPMPVDGLDAALGLPRAGAGGLALAVFLFGGCFCFGLIAYATIENYPLDVGGRPPFSWPYYVIPSIAIGLLFSALALLGAFLLSTQLPRLNHPAFDIKGIERASADRFFLCVYPHSETFDARAVEQFLRGLPSPPVSIRPVRQSVRQSVRQ